MNVKPVIITVEYLLRLIKSPFFYLICFISLPIIAVGDYYRTGQARRTIVFYSLEDGSPAVEERFIARTENETNDIRAYVEEILLGPSRWDAVALIDRAALLESFFVRERTVYIGLSGEAALTQANMRTGGLSRSLESIEQDIRRNFPSVHAVRFFVGGRETLTG